jgi:hypothetical protein
MTDQELIIRLVDYVNRITAGDDVAAGTATARSTSDRECIPTVDAGVCGMTQ